MADATWLRSIQESGWCGASLQHDGIARGSGARSHDVVTDEGNVVNHVQDRDLPTAVPSQHDRPRAYTRSV
jgi:hypothetical protein